MRTSEVWDGFLDLQDGFMNFLKRHPFAADFGGSFPLAMTNDEMFELYEARMKYQSDQATLLKSAEERGLKKGLEEGKLKGSEETRQKNREEIAQPLLAKGMALETIAEITQLSVEQIEGLK